MMEEELQCVVCRTIMCDPRVLSCQHMLCLRCSHGVSDRAKTDVTVKCPFGCGVTEVTDVRTLPRNTTVSNLCSGLREEKHKQNMLPCDYCCEGGEGEETDKPEICPTCKAAVCESCKAENSEHDYLCRSDERYYPFFIGWNAASDNLKKHLNRRGLSNATIKTVSRLYAPSHSLRVHTKWKIQTSTITTTKPLLTLCDNQLGSPSIVAEVEASGLKPLYSKQLSILYRLQEARGRQLALLKALDELLSNSELSKHLNDFSSSISNPTSWDGGLSNDIATLTEMLLLIYKQLCAPLQRKIHIISVLEGLSPLPGGNTKSSRAESRLLLNIVADMEEALRKQGQEEEEVFNKLQSTTTTLLQQQYMAYETWKGTVDHKQVIPATTAVLIGGAELIKIGNGSQEKYAASNSDNSSKSKIIFSISKIVYSGLYDITVVYASPQDTSITLSVGDNCITLELTATGGFDLFASKTINDIHLSNLNKTITLIGIDRTLGADFQAVEVAYSQHNLNSETLTNNVFSSSKSYTGSVQHEESLAVMAFCHHMQLEILNTFDLIYEEASEEYWKNSPKNEALEKEANIRHERFDLLSVLRNVQQVRIFQRQYYNCGVSGILQLTFSQPRPFPVMVPLPTAPSTSSLPNLLQSLQPKIHELREEQQNSVMREPPQHVQEQIQRVLLQTLELLHREQVLQLRESVQITRTQLIVHIAPDCVTEMLQNLTPDQRDAMHSIQKWTTVQDLQSVQLLWNRALEEYKDLPETSETATQNTNPTHHDVAVGTADLQVEEGYGDQHAAIPGIELGDTRLQNPLSLYATTDGENHMEIADESGIELDSQSDSLFAATETLASVVNAASVDPASAEDAVTELQQKIGDRLTKGVVDGLLKYTKLVILQRKRLEECIVELGAQEGSLGPLLVQKQRAVGAEADKLEVHLKIVEHLKKLLKLAQSCRSSSKKFELLSQVVLVLRKLQVGGSGSVPDKVDILSLQAWIDEIQHNEDQSLGTWSDTSSDGSTDSSEVQTAVGDPVVQQSLLAWFVRTESMTEIGLLERCLTTNGNCWDVPQLEFKPTQQSKKNCHQRAVAMTDKNWPIDLLICCSTLFLQQKFPFFEEWQIEMNSVPSECDFQVVSHIPFYKGEYVVPGGKTSQHFIINGQTGAVFAADPPLSLHRQLFQIVKDVLRLPTTWFVLNAVGLWARWSSSRLK